MSVLNSNYEFLLFCMSVQVADLGWTHQKQISEKPLEITIFVDVFDILKIHQVNENGVVLQKEL